MTYKYTEWYEPLGTHTHTHTKRLPEPSQNFPDSVDSRVSHNVKVSAGLSWSGPSVSISSKLGCDSAGAMLLYHICSMAEP